VGDSLKEQVLTFIFNLPSFEKDGREALLHSTSANLGIKPGFGLASYFQ
jgi:hypothetical protein